MKRHTLAFLLAGTAALVFASGAQAQTVYRIVGADGKVTFSDKPPVTAEQGKVEYKLRREAKAEILSLDEAVVKIRDLCESK